MEFKFNDAKSARPGHLERCLCYDKFLKGYRCYVYDDISKYWCTQATTEHDPDGENHIVDYADFQVTEWASLSNVNKPSIPSDLDNAAEEIVKEWNAYGDGEYKRLVIAGAKYAAPRWISIDDRLPKMDEDVIVLTNDDGFTHPCPLRIGFGHIVDTEATIMIQGKPYKPESHNGWNIPGVKYWMPCPEIPEV